MKGYDIFLPQKKHTGKFFETRIDSDDRDNAPQIFTYDIISPLSSSVITKFGNVLDINKSLTIQTIQPLTIKGKNIFEYKTEQGLYRDAMIQTDDKRLYRINQLDIDDVEDTKGERIPLQQLRWSYLLWLVPSLTGEEAWVIE